MLANMGADVTFKRYAGMPHTISREELAEAKALLAKSL